MQHKVLILDFGSQFTQLIARRVRELNIYSEIHPYNSTKFNIEDYKAVILSGSPHSVRSEEAPHPDLSEIKGKIPLLGVCYGAQYLAHFYEGEVGQSNSREYGRAHLTYLDTKEILFEGIHEKEGVSALEVVMTKIGAGGKFDKDSYKVSGGLHGVGVSCVNALSEHLTATVHKEGKVWQQEYSKGKALYPVKTVGETDFTGTIVTFSPDKTIFAQTTEYNYDTLSARLRELSYLNKGITITLTDKRNQDDEGNDITETFKSTEGLPEFIRYLDSTREQLTANVISMEGEKNGIPVEVAMVYNTSYSENLHSYVNNINTHEGLSLIHI